MHFIQHVTRGVNDPKLTASPFVKGEDWARLKQGAQGTHNKTEEPQNMVSVLKLILNVFAMKSAAITFSINFNSRRVLELLRLSYHVEGVFSLSG